ncbi:MAG: N-acetylmuramoyl-L-alanine amidase [Anaerolineae bacterium]|jgi:N-acetylmuramoyl-L-alanine amidase|nr:N-acetylmuramoyl-L-alanine amidase [Chloroflexota bacterium]
MSKQPNIPEALPVPEPPRPSAARLVSRFLGLLLLAAVGILTLLGAGNLDGLGSVLGLLRPRSATVGILAGHWKNDSGAVCEDGLTEVEINLAVAQAVVEKLRAEGIDAELLPEFDRRLNGYRSRVFVAIHTDSCVSLSGFKVARMTHANDPEAEDRLVQLLTSSYGQATGLEPHKDTITEDMRQYHALRRISPDTAGAIIELGFMGGDRALLTTHPEWAATGIARGIVAWLQESDTP